MRKRKNKSVGQLPTKTPERRTEKRNLRFIVISDDSEGKSDKQKLKSRRTKVLNPGRYKSSPHNPHVHKYKRIKEGRLEEQESYTYGLVQEDKGKKMRFCIQTANPIMHLL